jgi:hypothetical protein
LTNYGIALQERSVGNGNIHSKHDREASGDYASSFVYARIFDSKYDVYRQYVYSLDILDIEYVLVKLQSAYVHLLRHRQRNRERVYRLVRWRRHLADQRPYREYEQLIWHIIHINQH